MGGDKAVEYYRRAIDFAAVLAAGLLLLRIFAICDTVGIRLNHDEAEHLHVAFALERGERPYLDFIENHPMLFNLAIVAVKHAFGPDTVLGLHMLLRLFVLSAFLGCVYFIYRICADYGREAGGSFRASSLLLLVFMFFGILPEANSYLWDVRPDWFCYLLSLACIYTHFRAHARPTRDWTPGTYVRLAIGGVAGGLATAVLPKSIHVFAPYAIVLGIAFGRQLKAHTLDMRRLLLGNLLFLSGGILSLVAAIAWELSMTGATLESYYAANFVINRTMHPVASMQYTPLGQLLVFTRGDIGILLISLVASVLLLLPALRNGFDVESYMLVFGLSLVGFNTFLLSATNGAYWIHNFAPSLMGLLVVGFMLLHRLLVWLSRADRKLLTLPVLRYPTRSARVPIGYLAALLIVVWGGFSFAVRAGDAIDDLNNLRASRALRASLSNGQTAEFPTDRLLPADLTYLVFDVRSMPLRARHWGYYFMLGPDRGFWSDIHALGIGPDAGTYWKDLFAVAPPDAVLVQDTKDGFARVRERLLDNQGVDIAWLADFLKRDYVCFSQTVVTVFVRSELQSRFSGPKWKRC